MRIYRTPEARFEGLPDWPYAPKYVEIEGGLRVHYVDEGAADAQPVLMLHGEPSWSYLYRHMIGPVADAGFRALAPDLVGLAGRTSRWDAAITAMPGRSRGCGNGSRRWTCATSFSSVRTGGR